jgi:hypothetical protein
MPVSTPRCDCARIRGRGAFLAMRRGGDRYYAQYLRAMAQCVVRIAAAPGDGVDLEPCRDRYVVSPDE